MAWMRLEIGYVDHPKFVALSDGAFRLWHQGKSYCEQYLTDGLILHAVGKRLRGFTEARRRELQAVVAPYAAPLWEATALGWQMHDYLEYNDSRERQLARIEQARRDQARKRQNQAEYRARNGGPRDRSLDGHVAGSVTGHEPVTNAVIKAKHITAVQK